MQRRSERATERELRNAQAAALPGATKRPPDMFRTLFDLFILIATSVYSISHRNGLYA